MAQGDRNVPDLRTLFIDNHKPIIFVGEGNFTFSTAFAAMRGSWNGIISTTLADVLPNIERVKLDTLKAVLKNKKISGDESDETLTRMEKILSLPENQNVWHSLIDATKDLAKFESQRNIWFQCPWSKNSPVADLLKSFVAHCSTLQKEGDLLIIGISLKKVYFKQYDITTFLETFIPFFDYEFLGYDTNLIREILMFGYCHHSDIYPIHDNIFEYHSTIVLKKRKFKKELIASLPNLQNLNMRDVLLITKSSSLPNNATVLN